MTKAVKVLGAVLGIFVFTLMWANAATAASKADKCEAAKLKLAGKFAFCRLKAEAKAVKTGEPADYTKCEEKFGPKWTEAEAKSDGQCPTSGDFTDLHDLVFADGDFIVLKLKGDRFVDNGNGTITDTQTGLMWQKKSNLDGYANPADPHDADNSYIWCEDADVDYACDNSANPPNGTTFTEFLYRLNAGVSANGSSTTGCFANHCDWRLPTIEELMSILDVTQGDCIGSSGACIDPIFGDTPAVFHWSYSTQDVNGANVFGVLFFNGPPGVYPNNKAYYGFTRAVRSGP